MVKADDVDWKLIFQLSLFGLAMGIATVFFIPSNIEPIFWVVTFVVCAYIAKHLAARHFLHGLLLGLANSVWITASHILLFNRYIANHPRGCDDDLDAPTGLPASDDGAHRASHWPCLRSSARFVRAGCCQTLEAFTAGLRGRARTVPAGL